MRNTCNSNTASGIDIHDQAHPTVYENISENNKLCGIHFAHSTFGVARANRCNGNEVAGIAVLDEAHPTLEDNTCNNNKSGGIEFQDRARGIAKRNNCKNNAGAIAVANTASPILEDNEGDAIRTEAPPSGPASSSGDCFVVTATFGSPYSEEVGVYRAFRDEVLYKYWVGRAFIRVYYRVGPFAAEYVRPRRRLRTMLSVLLGRGAKLIR